MTVNHGVLGSSPCSGALLARVGSLAQLVQSVCLTSRGSGVRIPQLPPNESSRLQQCKRLFHEREHSSVGLERLLDKQEVSGSNPLVPTSGKAFRIRSGRLFCRIAAMPLKKKTDTCVSVFCYGNRAFAICRSPVRGCCPGRPSPERRRGVQRRSRICRCTP